ncbi:MAG: copper resistance protein CopZ, partial [Rhizobiales bacterium 32-66-8]
AATPAPAPAAAAAATYKVGDLVVEAPWSRATPNGAKVAGGYVKITNTGKTADKLVGGSFEQSNRFEVHEMAMNNGVMTMRPVKGGLEIAPGQSVMLAPGGFHLMFMDLKQPLKDGETVKGTLVFEKAGTLPVTFDVRGIGASAPAAAGAAPAGAMEHKH